MVKHINRIAVECDLYGGKRVVALAEQQLQVAGISAPGMRVSDVSKGVGNFLPYFRNLNVALVTIIGERYFANRKISSLHSTYASSSISTSDLGRRPFLPWRGGGASNSFLPSLRIAL